MCVCVCAWGQVPKILHPPPSMHATHPALQATNATRSKPEHIHAGPRRPMATPPEASSDHSARQTTAAATAAAASSSAAPPSTPKSSTLAVASTLQPPRVRNNKKQTHKPGASRAPQSSSTT